MSFAYLPFYTGDYMRDTRGLSMAGHGAYVLMLCYCWDSRGPLPPDVEEIAHVCGARSQEERTTMEKVLRRHFVLMDDGWYNRRMQREVEKAEALSAKRKYAGFKGYQAKAKQLPSKSSASAEQVPLTPTPTPYQHHTNKTKTSLSGSQANTDALRLLSFLNEKTGRRFRPTATTLKPILARLKEYSFDECRGVIVRRWVKWRDDDKMRDFLRPSTLFGATNFAQYIGDVPTREETSNADKDLS